MVSYQPEANMAKAVIVSNSLWSKEGIKNALVNIRSLLKPGGHLIMLSITDQVSICNLSILGCLASRWSSIHNSCGLSSPIMSTLEWSRVLRQSGFGGIDAISPKTESVHPLSTIVAQATDEKIDLIRNPLVRTRYMPNLGVLYLVGGDTFESSRLLDDVANMTRHIFDQVIHISNIDALDQLETTNDITVASFLDLSWQTSHDRDSAAIRALRTLVEKASSLLWITHGAYTFAPYSNAMSALVRSIASKIPDIRYQTLDFDSLENTYIQAKVCAEALLRLRVLSTWTSDDPTISDKMLWSVEPEVRFKDGRLVIPRIVPQKAYNNRLNGLRRPLMVRQTQDSAVQLVRDVKGSYALRELYSFPTLPSDTLEGVLAVDIKYSTASAFRVSEMDFLHLVLGQVAHTGDWVLALSSEQSSNVQIRRGTVALLPQMPIDPPGFLHKATLHILAGQVSKLMAPNCTAAIHEADDALASILVEQAKNADCRVIFSTEDPNRIGQQSLHLHPRLSDRVLRLALPEKIRAFVNLKAQKSKVLSSRIAGILGPSVNIQDVGDLIKDTPVGLDETAEYRAVLAHVAKMAWTTDTTDCSRRCTSTLNLVSLNDIVANSFENSSMTIIDWDGNRGPHLQVAELPTTHLFKKDRAYLLVGLQGSLEKSLCQWMARCGAGALVLANQNTQLDKQWVDEIEALGTTLKAVLV